MVNNEPTYKKINDNFITIFNNYNNNYMFRDSLSTDVLKTIISQYEKDIKSDTWTKAKAVIETPDGDLITDDKNLKSFIKERMEKIEELVKIAKQKTGYSNTDKADLKNEIAGQSKVTSEEERVKAQKQKNAANEQKNREKQSKKPVKPESVKSDTTNVEQDNKLAAQARSTHSTLAQQQKIASSAAEKTADQKETTPSKPVSTTQSSTTETYNEKEEKERLAKERLAKVEEITTYLNGFLKVIQTPKKIDYVETTSIPKAEEYIKNNTADLKDDKDVKSAIDKLENAILTFRTEKAAEKAATEKAATEKAAEETTQQSNNIEIGGKPKFHEIKQNLYNLLNKKIKTVEGKKVLDLEIFNNSENQILWTNAKEAILYANPDPDDKVNIQEIRKKIDEINNAVKEANNTKNDHTKPSSQRKKDSIPEKTREVIESLEKLTTSIKILIQRYNEFAEKKKEHPGYTDNILNDIQKQIDDSNKLLLSLDKETKDDTLVETAIKNLKTEIEHTMPFFMSQKGDNPPEPVTSSEYNNPDTDAIKRRKLASIAKAYEKNDFKDTTNKDQHIEFIYNKLFNLKDKNWSEKIKDEFSDRNINCESIILKKFKETWLTDDFKLKHSSITDSGIIEKYKKSCEKDCSPIINDIAKPDNFFTAVFNKAFLEPTSVFGYIKNNPLRTAAAVGAVGLGLYAYDRYRKRSSIKKQESESASNRKSKSKRKSGPKRKSKSKRPMSNRISSKKSSR